MAASKRRPWARAGDVYAIRNRTLGGVPIVEGFARLVRPARIGWLDPDEDRWLVEFGPGDSAERLIRRADRKQGPPALTEECGLCGGLGINGYERNRYGEVIRGRTCGDCAGAGEVPITKAGA